MPYFKTEALHWHKIFFEDLSNLRKGGGVVSILKEYLCSGFSLHFRIWRIAWKPAILHKIVLHNSSISKWFVMILPQVAIINLYFELYS